MVDEHGKATKYEIISVLGSGRKLKEIDEHLYEGKNVITGARRTIMQEEVLRLATPVDSSAQLFEEKGTTRPGKSA